MTVAPPARINLIAVIVATTAALIGRAWLQVALLEDGLQNDYAADLSYLVVPPILLILLFPILRHHNTFILELFSRDRLSTTLILHAIAIGFLLRLAEWCHLIAGVSFGWYRNLDPTAIVGPTFTFSCAAPGAVALGVIVMAMLVPFVEEVICRGLIQSWLSHRGAIFAISFSAFSFMLAHSPSAWGFAFLAGLVFGVQFWRTKTLWSSLITHATVNGLIQLDWRCLHGHWNPPVSELPILATGITSACVLTLSFLSIIYLLSRKKTGVHYAPRP